MRGPTCSGRRPSDAPTGYGLDGHAILRRPAALQDGPSMCFDRSPDRRSSRHRLFMLATAPAGHATKERQDFHSVPRGFELPPLFDLGGSMVGVHPHPTLLTLHPPGSGALQPYLEGIRFETLHFLPPASARRLVLACHADGPLNARAKLDDLSTQTFSVEAAGRVELSFDQAILEVLGDEGLRSSPLGGLGLSDRVHTSDHTANSFPLRSRKWNRRPPGNAKGSTVTLPPASLTLHRLSSRSRE